VSELQLRAKAEKCREMMEKAGERIMMSDTKFQLFILIVDINPQ